MKRGATIITERLILRPWDKAIDGAVFHRLNNDPEIMRFFPYRRDRAQSDVVLDMIEERLVRDGYGWCALVLKESGAVIGWAGLASVDDDMPPGPGMEIGWRLLPEAWGQGYATEAASALLDHAFSVLEAPEVMSFAVHDNHPSEAVMKRIGLKRDRASDFDHPRVPDTHPHLKRHIVYRLAQADWARNKGG